MVTTLPSLRYRLTASVGVLLLAATGIAATISPASAAPQSVVADGLSAAPRAVVPGSEVDLQVVIAGPASALAGSSYTYTVQLANNSLPDADGATFAIHVPGSSAGNDVAATCVASSGAVCGSHFVNGFSGEVTGQVGAFPHLGVVTITVTGVYPVGVTSTTASATVTAPAGTTDPDLVSNSSSVGTSLVAPVVNLSTTITQSQATIADGDVITYVMSYANDGPNAADKAFISASTYSSPDFTSSYTKSAHFIGCVAAGGAVCPTDLVDNWSSNSFYASEVPALPSGGTLVVTYQVSFSAIQDACGDYAAFLVSSDIAAPRGSTDPFLFDNRTGYLSAEAAIEACPATDLTANKTAENLTSPQSTTIAIGDVIRYTMSYTNAGPLDADGATISDSFGSSGQSSPVYDPSGEFVGCTTTGGAVCPDEFGDFHPDDDGYPDFMYRNRIIPAFPVGSTMTITYDVTFTGAAVAGCGADVTFANDTRIDPPRGLLDLSPQNNADGVRSDAEAPVCVPVDLSVTKTQSQDTIAPDDVMTYTVTYSNTGATPANGAVIADRPQWGDDESGPYNPTSQLLDCVTTGGAVCPVTLNEGFYTTTIPTFPAGSTVTITYEMTFHATAGGFCDSDLQFFNIATIGAPAGAIHTGGSGQAIVGADAGTCSDVAVNKTVSPAQVRAGNPVIYTIDVSNSSNTTADYVAVSDPLPVGFLFDSATCSVLSGSTSCGAVNYDSATRTVTSTIDSLGTGDAVRFVLAGTAGVQAATYTNTATAQPTPGVSRYIDTNPSSNVSQVNLQIFNTVSPIMVTKTIAGLSASGLDSPLTFTGTITCATQGSKPWSATVPAGESTGAAAPVSFWDGEPCVITEDTPPAAPAWTAWSGSPIIAPALIPLLGEATPVAVSVTNTLVDIPRGEAAVIVTKSIDGLTVEGLAAPLTFTGSVTCGTQPAQAWSATVEAGSSSGTAAALTFMEGERCIVTEDAVTAQAPEGYSWIGEPLISPATSEVLEAGQALAVTVTNTLDASAPSGAIDVTKVVTGAHAFSGDFGFAVFCDDDGTFATVVSLDGATTASATVLNVPAGAECTVTENARAGAPTGFGWDTPVYSIASLVIVADATSEISVTNPLKAAEVPVTPHVPAALPSGLASTGAVTIPILGTALALLLAGVATMIARRRRVIQQ